MLCKNLSLHFEDNFGGLEIRTNLNDEYRPINITGHWKGVGRMEGKYDNTAPLYVFTPESSHDPLNGIYNRERIGALANSAGCNQAIVTSAIYDLVKMIT